ncbi:ABC transporter permease [Actinorhabdospora filicis]|uniref:ABC transporter permease n=1 Tax=Actinorhabdospora filicis TaxID=1785913 RepID=A0A9W6WC60_9ACTN|nr:iron chelate uptake ABC transporter family permease subunit [Actinorhabdospora filicis]GLZ79430.1 ABC transporter permease [Actinorhabdospora filicis]
MKTTVERRRVIRPRPAIALTVTALLTLAVAVYGLTSGDYPITPAGVVKTLVGLGDATDAYIVNELRLPRVAAALVVGAALGLSGALLQALVRNGLASPDVLGVTNGASVGALGTIVLIGGGSVAVAAGAAVGGIAIGVLLMLLSGRAQGNRLVLAGVAITAILSGVIGWLLTKAQLVDAARATLWLTGSLDGRGWDDVLPPAVALVLVLPVLVLYARPLAMLEMGDDSATALGVRVARTKALVMLSSVLLASFAAAAAGPVSFVALTAPHLARRASRATGPNLAASAVFGAALLVCADWAAQHLVPGRQLPVGAVTGLLGGGYLIWLLVMERRAGRL